MSKVLQFKSTMVGRCIGDGMWKGSWESHFGEECGGGGTLKVVELVQWYVGGREGGLTLGR